MKRLASAYFLWLNRSSFSAHTLAQAPCVMPSIAIASRQTETLQKQTHAIQDRRWSRGESSWWRTIQSWAFTDSQMVLVGKKKDWWDSRGSRKKLRRYISVVFDLHVFDAPQIYQWHEWQDASHQNRLIKEPMKENSRFISAWKKTTWSEFDLNTRYIHEAKKCFLFAFWRHF